MPTAEGKEKENIGYFKTVVKGFFVLLVMTAVMFTTAGRINYWQGWLFSGTCVLVLSISSIMFAGKTDLVKERIKPGPGTKWWDKIFWALYVPLNFAVVVVACLDAGRFSWSHLPAPVYIFSYITLITSISTTQWAMWTNRWFSSTVRIQKDRGQQVVQNGPYRFVRHPGYVGGILLVLSMSLVLGSLLALIPAVAAAILLVIRTYLEDETLKEELPGYVDYAKKVRYRLLSGIW